MRYICSGCDTTADGPEDGLPDGWYPQISKTLGAIPRCPACSVRNATRIATAAMSTEDIMSAGQDGQATDAVTTAAQNRLKSLISRVQNLREDALVIAADIKEVFDEAKGEGFDVKVMRKLITEMQKDTVQRQEEQALLELYASAVGFRL
ncbi:MAG: DUF2312 domain-containing protein [Asticcacaulis sp.]